MELRKFIKKTIREYLNESVNNDVISTIYQKTTELSNIGTLEQYKQYLGGIFPQSKVKEIVYHSSPNKIEKFNDSYFGIYFSYSPITHGGYGGNVHAALLNIKNPLTIPKNREELAAYDKEYRTYMNFTMDYEGYRTYKYDGSVESSSVSSNGLQVRTRTPEQIHILGSEQDIEGFKVFLNK